MFNEELSTQTSNSAELLDIHEYIQQSTNNKKFAKIVREFLVQFHKQRNRLLTDFNSFSKTYLTSSKLARF